LERAKEAIKLMRKGVSISEACKKSGTSHGTVIRALDELGITDVVTKTTKGRLRIISDAASVEKAKCVLRKMQYDGLSATAACYECHTKLRTIKAVRIDGTRCLLKRWGTYRQQVYEVRTLPVVVYGRLRNVGSPRPITYTQPMEVPKDISLGSLREDNYASILWQYDIEKFRTTLNDVDICDYYLPLIFRFLRDRMVSAKVTKTIVGWLARMGPAGLSTLTDAGVLTEEEAEEITSGSRPYDMSLLEEIFKLGVDFDEDVQCGVDSRDEETEWVSKSDLRRRDPFIDVGDFQVIVSRRTGTAHYPPLPRRIPYDHRLMREIDWKED